MRFGPHSISFASLRGATDEALACDVLFAPHTIRASKCFVRPAAHKLTFLSRVLPRGPYGPFAATFCDRRSGSSPPVIDVLMA